MGVYVLDFPIVPIRANCHARRWLLTSSVAVALLCQGFAFAQSPATSVVDSWQRPVIGKDLSTALYAGPDPVDSGPISPTPRILLFHMLPGFLSDPPELSGADDAAADAGTSSSPSGNQDGFVISFGDDNPFFDPRRPGDPGGVGFVRIHSQVQVLDWGSTSVCFGLRAWTPAGLENGGVQSGSTVMSPGIAVFQEIAAGSALHGFVDQSLHNCYHQGPMRCGVALDCPINGLDPVPDRSVFFFVQALGRLDYGADRQGRSMNWAVVPGIQWRLSDTLGLSLGASRQSILTCWWHF